MGRKPSPKHSIERINNDGNYEPSNCKWATKMEQASNTRDIIKFFVNGKEDTLRNWARAFKVPHCRVSHRIKNGWKPEDALTIPPYSRYKPRGQKR